MSTLGQIVEFVRHSLSGFDANKDAVVALSASVSASDLSLPIDDTAAASGVGRGIVEIDMEKIRVARVDTEQGALVVTPTGRGYRGTVAASHAAGAEVRINPAWAASTVAQEVNGVLREIYPRLYAVKEHETVFPSDLGAIDLPDEATGIIAVYIGDSLNADQWIREDRWVYQPDSTKIGRGLRVGGARSIGDRIRVVYAVQPGVFDLNGPLSQDFETVTGLPERVSDLIRLGVATRMAPFIDVARLPFVSAEARADESRSPQGGAAAGRLLYSMFQDRLEREVQVLHREHPIRLHFTGRA